MLGSDRNSFQSFSHKQDLLAKKKKKKQSQWKYVSWRLTTANSHLRQRKQDRGRPGQGVWSARPFPWEDRVPGPGRQPRRRREQDVRRERGSHRSALHSRAGGDSFAFSLCHSSGAQSPTAGRVGSLLGPRGGRAPCGRPPLSRGQGTGTRAAAPRPFPPSEPRPQDKAEPEDGRT